MYDLVDRPVAELGTFERRLLWKTRSWVQAMAIRGTSRAAQDDSFEHVMRTLDAGSSDSLRIELPCHDSVGETEAVLLSLWRLVRDGRDAAARAAAAMIVDRGGADTVVGAMRRTVHA